MNKNRSPVANSQIDCESLLFVLDRIKEVFAGCESRSDRPNCRSRKSIASLIAEWSRSRTSRISRIDISLNGDAYRDVNNLLEGENLRFPRSRSIKIYIPYIAGHERARISGGLSALPFTLRTQQSRDLIARTLSDKPRRRTLIDRHLIDRTHARLRASTKCETASILRDCN